MNNTFLRNYQTLTRRIRNEGKTNLSEFFNIINTPINNIKITLKLVDIGNKLLVNIDFSSKRYLEEAENIKNIDIGLPMELNIIISEFVPINYFFNYKIELEYPDGYPFDPPIWKLNDIKSNLFFILDREYFQYLIDDHNEINSISWSATIKIDKDILIFYAKLKCIIEYILKNS